MGDSDSDLRLSAGTGPLALLCFSRTELAAPPPLCQPGEKMHLPPSLLEASSRGAP